jgi:hypothetical protein
MYSPAQGSHGIQAIEVTGLMGIPLNGRPPPSKTKRFDFVHDVIQCSDKKRIIFKVNRKPLLV